MVVSPVVSARLTSAVVEPTPSHVPCPEPRRILSRSCIIGAASWQVMKRSYRCSNQLQTLRPLHLTSFLSLVLSVRMSYNRPIPPDSPATLDSGISLGNASGSGFMDRDVKAFIWASLVCAQEKSSHQPPAGLLNPLDNSWCPWSHIAVDFVTGCPPSLGNNAIFTVVVFQRLSTLFLS